MSGNMPAPSDPVLRQCMFSLYKKEISFIDTWKSWKLWKNHDFWRKVWKNHGNMKTEFWKSEKRKVAENSKTAVRSCKFWAPEMSRKYKPKMSVIAKGKINKTLAEVDEDETSNLAKNWPSLGNAIKQEVLINRFLGQPIYWSVKITTGALYWREYSNTHRKNSESSKRSWAGPWVEAYALLSQLNGNKGLQWN